MIFQKENKNSKQLKKDEEGSNVWEIVMMMKYGLVR